MAVGGYQYGLNDIVFARDLGRSSMIGLMCLFYDMRPWAMRRLIRRCAPRAAARTCSVRRTSRWPERAMPWVWTCSPDPR